MNMKQASFFIIKHAFVKPSYQLAYVRNHDTKVKDSTGPFSVKNISYVNIPRKKEFHHERSQNCLPTDSDETESSSHRFLKGIKCCYEQQSTIV